MNNRILNFIDAHNLLSGHQYGFSKQKSTENAIIKLTSHIINSLANDKKTLAVFLDLAKAFDTILHANLLEKLQHYGVWGLVSKLINIDLDNRKHGVKIGNSYSPEKHCHMWSPPRYCIGPHLLFLDKHVHGKIIVFANDTVLLFEGSLFFAFCFAFFHVKLVFFKVCYYAVLCSFCSSSSPFACWFGYPISCAQ